MSSLQRESKIYGAVESESYITFTGFCKRIYDTAQQSVDVFIDEEKVATLLANEKIHDIEEKYEVFDTNGFCFTYELPKKYIGQKHKLEFKTQNGEQLLHSPTHTLDKFSPLYNQAMFIESLNKPIKYAFEKEGYTKNALSFIVIEENLSDEAFIAFVLEMCKKHKELSLTLFYFNEHQKNQAIKQFKQIKNKQFINPSSVEEMIKSSEIYLHNVIEEFRFTINEEYYNKVKNQSAIKENLFVLELTRKAKKKKDMTEMVIDMITPILFETSVLAQMFKEDERYNEFVFMNSLGSVDEDKIKDRYCPNAIGFLATKENLEDEVFMGYIKELMERFPDVLFKGFCFSKIESQLFENSNNFSFKIINNIAQLILEIEFFIWDLKNYLDLKIAKIILANGRNIYNVFNFKNPYFINLNETNLATYDRFLKNNNEIIISNSQLFGFTEEEISLYGHSYTKLMYEALIKREDNTYILDISQDALEFLQFEQIKLALKYKKFKKKYIEIHKKRNAELNR
ncbi:MAG: hypothetical protein AB7D96_03685 [Arcobacteraceae bacterium]